MWSFDEALTGQYAYLLRYATSLTKDREAAKDLVQDTMVKALAHVEQFTPGTNLGAWLTVILHRTFLTDMRKLKTRRRHMRSLDGHDVSVDAQEQFFALALKEAAEWMETLPPDQRRALGLVGVEGLSYESAAQRAGVPIGTIKSRVNRARVRMQKHKPDTES